MTRIVPLDILPAPLPSFSSKVFQFWNGPKNDNDTTLFFDSRYCPTFCYRRPSSPNSMWAAFLCNDMVPEAAISFPLLVTTADGWDYIAPKPHALLSTPIPDGRWYLRVFDGVNSFYTEWFNATSCLEGKLMVTWGNACVAAETPHSRLIYNNTNPMYPKVVSFQYSMLLSTPLGDRILNTDVEEVINGDNSSRTSVRTRYTWLLNDVFAPYMLDCFHAMQHYSEVALRQIGPGSEYLDSVAIAEKVESDPTASGMQTISATFRIKRDWYAACCGDPVAPCLGDVFLAEWVGNSEALPEIGVGAGQSYVRWDEEPNTVNGPTPPYTNTSVLPVGTIVQAAHDQMGLVPNTGMLFIRVAAPLSYRSFVPLCPQPTVIGIAPLTVFVTLMPVEEEILAMNRFVELQYSASPDGPWVVSAQATELSVMEFGMEAPVGVGGSLYFRLRYFTYDCDHGAGYIREAEVDTAYELMSCDYMMDITPHFHPNIGSLLEIYSFIVDGVDYGTATQGVGITDNYIVFEGLDWLTNLADLLNSMDVPYFSFGPAGRLPGESADSRATGSWMAITYPVGTEWTIDLRVYGARFKYTNTGRWFWDEHAGEWITAFYYDPRAQFPQNCETVG